MKIHRKLDAYETKRPLRRFATICIKLFLLIQADDFVYLYNPLSIITYIQPTIVDNSLDDHPLQVFKHVVFKQDNTHAW